MSGNLKANTVCNQVLKVLKQSNLNYLVNETPYSAFVTIRKKFVRTREDQELLDVTPVDDISVNDIVLTQENLGLKQKCRDLSSDKGHLQIKIEELELKVEAIVKENNIFKEKLSQLD